MYSHVSLLSWQTTPHSVGLAVGSSNELEATIGLAVGGDFVEAKGAMVGAADAAGLLVGGDAVVGVAGFVARRCVGLFVGLSVGLFVGRLVGDAVNVVGGAGVTGVGFFLGLAEGLRDGADVITGGGGGGWQSCAVLAVPKHSPQKSLSAFGAWFDRPPLHTPHASRYAVPKQCPAQSICSQSPQMPQALHTCSCCCLGLAVVVSVVFSAAAAEPLWLLLLLLSVRMRCSRRCSSSTRSARSQGGNDAHVSGWPAHPHDPFWSLLTTLKSRGWSTCK
jgi:hypothetical protein